MIGILGSGLGGLAVARAIHDRLAGYDLLYYGDTARMPYGECSAAVVTRFTREGLDLLRAHGAGILVAACDTISAVAVEPLRARFDRPLLDIVTPAAAQAVAVSPGGRIGVAAARTTLESGCFDLKIGALRRGAKVFGQPCPLLGPLVDEGWETRPETASIVRKYMLPLKVRRIDTLIPASPQLMPLVPLLQRKLGRRVRLVDPPRCLAEHLAGVLQDDPGLAATLGRNDFGRYMVSDLTPACGRTAARYFGRNVRLEAL